MPKQDSNRTFQKAAKLFAEALDLATEDREAFLQKACGEDRRLWQQARSLLEADQQAGRFFRRPLFDIHALTDSGEPEASSPKLPLARFPPGTELAERYRILGLLGKGGMGEVYRAEDLMLGLTVALKFLPPKIELAPDAVRRFLDEARLAREISHSNVCRVHDIGEIDGLRFLSMEYIAGENLASLFRRIGQVTVEKAIEIGCQIALGLTAIHRQGVLHRDLKPANILLDEQGQIRIADFGIALEYDASNQNEREGFQNASPIGTPAYMAPEVLAGGKASVGSDLYSLGLILFEIMTGERPFAGSSPREWLEARRHPLETSLASLVPGLRPDLEKLIRQCLDPDPKKRPKSARILASALAGQASLQPQTCLRVLLIADSRLPKPFWPRYQREIHRLRIQHQGLDLAPESGAETLLAFPSPARALEFCRALQRRFSRQEAMLEHTQTTRMALHLAEVLLTSNPDSSISSSEVETSYPSVSESLLVRMKHLCAQAHPHLLLTTRPVFDLVQLSPSPDEPISKQIWRHRGLREVKGWRQPVDLYELDLVDRASQSSISSFLKQSSLIGSSKAGAKLGDWRPSHGQPLPGRPHWWFDYPLQTNEMEEIWVTCHGKTLERRRLNIWTDPVRTEIHEQVINIYQKIRQELGDRPDIAKLMDWNFDAAPFFVETSYTGEGDLRQWARRRRSLAEVPLPQRLKLFIQTAAALDAIHSIGVAHGRLRPESLLIARDSQDNTIIRLSDFGHGAAFFSPHTETDRSIAPGFESRFYLAPEQLEGRAPSPSSDLYALGVLLFQLILGDLGRALAPGWHREITEPLLADDVGALIAREPEQRISAEDVVDRLRNLESRRRTQKPHQTSFLSRLSNLWSSSRST